jgi:hypothetical protein
LARQVTMLPPKVGALCWWFGGKKQEKKSDILGHFTGFVGFQGMLPQKNKLMPQSDSA